MRILLTGSSGQLGRALRTSMPATLAGELWSRSPRPVSLSWRRAYRSDLADPDARRAAVIAHQPDWILNAGAYTAADWPKPSWSWLRPSTQTPPPREAVARINDGSRMLQISTISYSTVSRAIPTGQRIPSIP